MTLGLAKTLLLCSRIIDVFLAHQNSGLWVGCLGGYHYAAQSPHSGRSLPSSRSDVTGLQKVAEVLNAGVSIFGMEQAQVEISQVKSM